MIPLFSKFHEAALKCRPWPYLFIRKLAPAVAALSVMVPAAVHATNGSNLIGVGPVSRGMGGLSIACPQDTISAVFGNPAAMCNGNSERDGLIDISVTAFLPQLNASISGESVEGGSVTLDGREHVYPIPAIGISLPVEDSDKWLLGFAAYGVSGMGVDYRDTAFTGAQFGGDGAPLLCGAGDFVLLQVMKLAPSVAYRVSPALSVGASFHLDYAVLDMGAGESSGFGAGAQFGLIYRPRKNLSLGLTYQTAQEVKHEDVLALPSGRYDLTLESPRQVGAGAALKLSGDRLVLGVEGKWINWGDAKGYGDFGWSDQWVFALGAQYAVVPETFYVRAGFNYGEHPIEEHDGWDGSLGEGHVPAESIQVQDASLPRYYYETFRIIGFPVVAERHLTFGFTYSLSETVSVSAAYMHAFENSITETGIAPDGSDVTLSAGLREHSLELGVQWRF